MKPSGTHRTWKYQVTGRGSTAVETLETAWSMLSEIDPRIPPAVLTFVDKKSRSRVLGYFANSTWRKRRGAAHEIAINPILIGHAESLVATMLHEAVHAMLYESGDRGGMGSTPYYHTKVFRDRCLESGLECEFLNSRYGWTITSWPASGAPSRYKKVVAIVRKQLPAGTGEWQPSKAKSKPLPMSGHRMLACECEDRTIYVKKSVLEAGGVVCAFCGREFKPVQ